MHTKLCGNLLNVTQAHVIKKAHTCAEDIQGLSIKPLLLNTKQMEAATMKSLSVASLVAFTLIATAALAQNGPGMGGGYGGRGRAWDKSSTPGWTLMTEQERTDWRTKMHAAKTYDECLALREEHHKLMETRAKEKGVTLPTPRRNGCDMMKSRGYFQ